ncbi:MAG: DUF2946 family protein [Alphaproteobacteria bacterium]|jgi:hypothetical protein|nr:DUF2946 family protein [Alphaproteobacteria bacterium]
MAHLRRHSHWALVPAVLWIAAQFAMTAQLGGPFTFGSASAGTGDPFGDIVICTGQGPKVVTGSALPPVAGGPDGGSTPRDATGEHCFWCPVLGSIALPVPPGEAALPAAEPATVVDWHLVAELPGFPPAAACFHSRAPPA